MELFDLDIFNTLDNNCKEDNYVAIATMRSNNQYYHSALIINFLGEKYEYHFDKEGIKFDKVCNIYLYKILNVIDKRLTPSFYVHCKRIKDTSNPKYGYFYSGEYYDKNGKHFSENPIGEHMTCVGFCINVLKGFIGKEYIDYKDWDIDTHNVKDYLENFAKVNKFKISDILKSHRRITPLELFTSSYFISLPITKYNIDSKVDDVSIHLDNIPL